MKIIYACLCLLLGGTTLFAQFDDRKGAVLVETEYNVFGGVFGGGTGIGVLSASGSTLTSVGLDGGYFIGQDLALLLRLGIVSADGSSLTSFGAGLKYYLLGTIPLSAEAGVLSVGGGSVFTVGLNAGYAIRLANNVALEPYAGVSIIDADAAFQGGIRFALFL